MSSNELTVFRRVHGRVVPIKVKKDDVNGVASLGSGILTSSVIGSIAGKDIKNSWQYYKKAAHARGVSFGLSGVKKAEAIRTAATLKVTGKALAKRGFGLLSLGLTIGSGLASYGAYKLTKDRTEEKTGMAINTLAAGAATGAGLFAFRKMAGLKHIANAVKRAGFGIAGIERTFVKEGRRQTEEALKKFKALQKLKVSKRIKKPFIDPNQTRLF